MISHMAIETRTTTESRTTTASRNKTLRLINAAGAEFIGTSFFLFITVTTVVNYTPSPVDGSAVAPIGIATVFGTTIGALIFAVGNVSGAHLNPSVTIAFVVQRSVSVATGAIYIVSQVAGATVGALLARAVSNHDLYANSQAVNFVQPGFHVWQSFLAEVIATAFLVTVVLQVSGLLPVNDVGRHVLGLLVPIAVGAAIVVAHLALIPIDGCGINPARSLGAVIAASGKAPSKAWSQIWVFLVGPFVGGVIPALVKTVVPTTLPPEEDREVEAPMAISPAPATISDFRAPRIVV